MFVFFNNVSQCFVFKDSPKASPDRETEGRMYKDGQTICRAVRQRGIIFIG